jgi:hypothetical protein
MAESNAIGITGDTDRLRDERGFWAMVREFAAEEDEARSLTELAAAYRSTWPLLGEECREGYRQMADNQSAPNAPDAG